MHRFSHGHVFTRASSVKALVCWSICYCSIRYCSIGWSVVAVDAGDLAMLSYLSWVPCRATRLTIWLDPEPLTETPSGKLFLHTSYQSISASHAILWSFSVSALIHVHKLHFISICSAFNRMQEHFKFFFLSEEDCPVPARFLSVSFSASCRNS